MVKRRIIYRLSVSEVLVKSEILVKSELLVSVVTGSMAQIT
jgi:hypothetical protein